MVRDSCLALARSPLSAPPSGAPPGCIPRLIPSDESEADGGVLVDIQRSAEHSIESGNFPSNDLGTFSRFCAGLCRMSPFLNDGQKCLFNAVPKHFPHSANVRFTHPLI